MITAWLEIGLSNALVATLLALMAFLVTRRMRPQWAFAVWLLVLVKLLMPPVWNAPLGSLQTLWPASGPHAQIDWLAGDPLVAQPTRTTHSPIPREVAVAPVALTAPTAVDPTAVFPSAAIFCLWLLGTLLWIALAARRIRAFAISLRRTRRAPAHQQAEVEALARQLRLQRVPQLRLTYKRVPPLVWAWHRSGVILLPLGLLGRLTAPQRTALILHELLHLRRRDHLTKFIELTAVALYWWLPAAWWARSRASEAAEQCCDADVLACLPAASRAYAEALVLTIDFLSDSRAPLPLGASGFSQFGHVSRRIEMILAPVPVRRPAWWRPVAALLLALAVLPVSVQSLWAEPADPPAAAKPEDSRKTRSTDSTPTADGGEFTEGKGGKDWTTHSKVDAVEVEKQFVRIVRRQHLAAQHAQSYFKRREAAEKQLRALHKAYDDGTATLDQLLQAQLLLYDFKRAYAAAVCDISFDPDRRNLLLAEANLVIANQSLKEARDTWAIVHKRTRDVEKGGEPKLEAMAREQFYLLKQHVKQALMKYQQARDEHGKRTGALPTDAEIIARAKEVETMLQNQDEKPFVINGPVTAGGPPRALDPPSDDEILRAAMKVRYELGRAAIERKNVRIIKEKLVEKVEPPSKHPELGRAQQYHTRYRCSIYGTTPTGHETSDVIYIDHRHYHVAPETTEAKPNTVPPGLSIDFGRQPVTDFDFGKQPVAGIDFFVGFQR